MTSAPALPQEFARLVGSCDARMLVWSNERGKEIMSEAMGDRARMERRVIERSLADDAFRTRLLEDPRATMEQELGVRLPPDVRVQAVEETVDTIYLVLPSSSAVGEGTELSDRELESVAGGAPGPTASGDTCSTVACGGFTCLDDPDCGL